MWELFKSYWFVEGNNGICSLCKLESKLLKGGYIGDQIGDHY